MEASALRYAGGRGLPGRTPLLRLQSDERLIAFIRRGNPAAFEVLVARYQSRLLAFCRHLLGSREDAEDVLQEVLAAAFNAILADDRPINVRPWLYRIARNRSLNHLRRVQPIGVDSMDVHLFENGASTADKAHDREQFRLLVGDIHELPETQRTALVLREMDALSYEQIAEAMDTTVPGVKSLLVRARISLAEAAESRMLSCEEVRIELAEVAEGLRRRPEALVRRHIRSCRRCSSFQGQLKQTNKALAALLPIGPMALMRKLLIIHLGHSAGTGSGATGATAGATSAGVGAGAAPAAVAGAAGTTGAIGSAGGVVSAGAAAIASKAAASLAAAAIVTAGAVEASRPVHHHAAKPVAVAAVQPQPVYHQHAYAPAPARPTAKPTAAARHERAAAARAKLAAKRAHTQALAKSGTTATATDAVKKPTSADAKKKKVDDGRTSSQTDPTVLPPSTSAQPTSTTTTGTPSSDGTTTTPSSDGSTTGTPSSSGGVGLEPTTTTPADPTTTPADPTTTTPADPTTTTPADPTTTTPADPTGDAGDSDSTSTDPSTDGSSSSTGTDSAPSSDTPAS